MYSHPIRYFRSHVPYTITACSSCTRVPGPRYVLTTTHYNVSREDFDRMAAGHAPQDTCFAVVDNGLKVESFEPVQGSPHLAAMMREWNKTQDAHTYGARSMEASWSL